MTGSQSHIEKKSAASAHIEIILLIAAVALLALYAILRNGGLWGENDTAVFTKAIHSMSEAGTLTPDKNVYDNGYGFPALAVFLIQVTGISLNDFQLFGAALLAVWMVLPAWLLYREFTGSSRGATLATVILFVQPEFLFPIIRGSHEKFTRGMMFLCLYLLLRSLRSKDKLVRFTGFLLSFYLTAYALITFNNLIATSFILSVGLSLALAWALGRTIHGFSSTISPTIKRLIYVVISLMIVSFIFTFYAYPPAIQQLRLLVSVGDRVAALLLPMESTAINPYGVVSAGWVSLPVYFLVSLADWILLVVSAAIWLGQGYTWWLRRHRSPEQMELLLWAFYGAFAFLGVISIIVDVSGAISGNLQHRMFPAFAMIAAPLVARWLVNWKPRSFLKTRPGHAGMAALIGVLAVLSAFKATNEPLLSNKWMFYVPAEIQAIQWADGKLAGKELWTEFDERLSTSYTIWAEGVDPGVILKSFQAVASTRNFLVSDVIRQRSLRLSVPIPINSNDLITYDNGQAQIFHLRPRTPYQH
jgi:hypothetical protein